MPYVVDAKEELKAIEDVGANFLVDLEKQQSITAALNVKVDLKETEYHQTLGEFHNHGTKIKLVIKATIVAQ